ncbi:tudor domain-containing protein [Spirosoma koreense]
MSNVLNNYSPMQSALALLQPTVSYAQKRADADRNLMYQSGLAQMAQQDAEAAKQQQLLLKQQQAQLASVPFLEQDQRRWQSLLDQGKQKIRSRIEKDFGGDYEQYARSGMLDQDMQNMALEAQRHPLYAGSLQRRSNFLQAQKDAQDGKIYRPVQYRLRNGQVKVAPWEQAYQDFADDNTEDLPYNGGFKVDGKWQKLITDNYSPRVGQLGKFKTDYATPDEVLTALTTGEGLTAQDAAEYYRRTAPLLGRVQYKVDVRNPYEEERLRQGWSNIGLRKQQLAEQKRHNQKSEQQAGQSQIDMWDATFNNPDNVITRQGGQPSTVNVTLFDPNMQATGSGKLQGFTGKVVGPALLEATGAKYDKKTGYWQGAGGQAYVSVPNAAGGVDLRQTDLSGLNYTTKPGNIYRYETQPTEYERATGRKPYRYMQEQTIVISSDEAKKARSGNLFASPLSLGNDYSSGFNPFGNSDTPTSKGAYTTRKNEKGNTEYLFRILQPVEPTMLDRQSATWNNMQTQTKTGQAVLSDADDDLNYY